MPFLCVGGTETSEGVILSGLDVEGVSAGCFCMCVVQPLAFGVLKKRQLSQSYLTNMFAMFTMKMIIAAFTKDY